MNNDMWPQHESDIPLHLDEERYHSSGKIKVQPAFYRRHGCAITNLFVEYTEATLSSKAFY